MEAPTSTHVARLSQLFATFFNRVACQLKGDKSRTPLNRLNTLDSSCAEKRLAEQSVVVTLIARLVEVVAAVRSGQFPAGSKRRRRHTF